MQYIIVTAIEFPCVDWRTRTATKEVPQLEYINIDQDRMPNEVSSVPAKLHPCNLIGLTFSHKKIDTTILFYAHPINDQGGLL